ncbi:dethiobiotin synthase [Paracrocinitomix mangrovi]|uniref:dethiobiotin synthase n=1 Tax=Paracrocinitomix mangrovi TaxID=2862509 RepID=UPI001C8E846F|nr:dethiobiotin synthase [Paracrocinitomix mangrovi]UKN03024.1 dethiobiotin synthase [Paracrocinitomix mangrovi]
MGNKIFVTGIGTEIGKTFCSAIVCEALHADYWKPLQAGELDDLDSLWVRDFISNAESKFHTERFLLSEPMSPHAAAKLDDIEIELSDFKVPETSNDLIIEGAGGLMVPLNDKGDMIIDLIPLVADEVILVSMNYLGSINHTLMSVDILRQRKIPIKGIIFNGDSNQDTEDVILQYTGLQCLAKIPMADSDIKEFVKEQAAILRPNLI